jgi:hypothetical protein
MQLQKETGTGEHLLVHIEQYNPITGEMVHEDIAEMAEVMEQALHYSDTRLHQMNMRHITAYQLESFFEPGEWLKVLSILDIIAGRVDAAIVRKRWESIREENAALTAAREEAEAQRMARCTCGRDGHAGMCSVHTDVELAFSNTVA